MHVRKKKYLEKHNQSSRIPPHLKLIYFGFGKFCLLQIPSNNPASPIKEENKNQFSQISQSKNNSSMVFFSDHQGSETPCII